MRKNVVYVGFMNLEKAYDRVNREELCSYAVTKGMDEKIDEVVL